VWRRPRVDRWAPQRRRWMEAQGGGGCVTSGEGEPVGTCAPPTIVQTTSACLDAVDLDPCAGRPAGAEIPAQRSLGLDESDLNRAWRGRVGLNPPYGCAIGFWIARLCEGR